MRVEITEDEKRNGWTQEALDKYRRSRNRQQHRNIFKAKEIVRPQVQNHGYNPLKWRR